MLAMFLFVVFGDKETGKKERKEQNHLPPRIHQHKNVNLQQERGLQQHLSGNLKLYSQPTRRRNRSIFNQAARLSLWMQAATLIMAAVPGGLSPRAVFKPWGSFSRGG